MKIHASLGGCGSSLRAKEPASSAGAASPTTKLRTMGVGASGSAFR